MTNKGTKLRPRINNDKKLIDEVVRKHKQAIRARKTAGLKSQEFKQSVIDAVDNGARRRELARRLEVSESYIYDILEGL